jgi:hypothetical protein
MSQGSPELPGLAAANTAVIFEQRFVPGPASATHRQPSGGEKIVSRLVLEFDIDEDGKVSSCREVHREGDVAAADPCARRSPSFEPPVDGSGKPRVMKGQMIISAYVRTESVT